AASDAVEAVTETATDTAVDAATDAASDATGGIADLLTTDGFNLDKVSEMIDGSEIGALKKTALKTALSSAQENPELLQGVLDQIKSAMGL
ncbi:MAG: hypothetical protein ABJQ89_10055, partial [Planktotalea sp.]